jgi:pre-mRNA-splicing factor 18
LLKEWEIELEQRPENVKNSSQGKMDSGTYTQTRKYVKPLLKKLKNRTLQPDVVTSLYQICSAMAEREYVKANHEYLQLAIGNAPWPMGVTMVGIHERSAREKISNNKIAHILNDEQTRKYIQSVKRMMTYCQKRYPTDPSRMVV